MYLQYILMVPCDPHAIIALRGPAPRAAVHAAHCACAPARRPRHLVTVARARVTMTVLARASPH